MFYLFPLAWKFSYETGVLIHRKICKLYMQISESEAWVGHQSMWLGSGLSPLGYLPCLPGPWTLLVGLRQSSISSPIPILISLNLELSQLTLKMRATEPLGQRCLLQVSARNHTCFFYSLMCPVCFFEQEELSLALVLKRGQNVKPENISSLFLLRHLLPTDNKGFDSLMMDQG